MWYRTVEVSNIASFIPESFEYIAAILVTYH